MKKVSLWYTHCLHSLALYFCFPALRFQYHSKLYNKIALWSKLQLFAQYFKKRFYEILSMGDGRKTYAEAARFVEGMFKLNNGTEITEMFIKELKNSLYAKRTALFDEILTVLNQDERNLKWSNSLSWICKIMIQHLNDRKDLLFAPSSTKMEN